MSAAKQTPFDSWSKKMSGLLRALREADQLGADEVCIELRDLIDEVRREMCGV